MSARKEVAKACGYVFDGEGDRMWEQLVVVLDGAGGVSIFRRDNSDGDHSPPVIELGPVAAAVLAKELMAAAEMAVSEILATKADMSGGK